MRGKRLRYRGGMRGRSRGRGSKKRRRDNSQNLDDHNISNQRQQRSKAPRMSNVQETRSNNEAGAQSLLQPTEDDWSSESEGENPLDQLLLSFGQRPKSNSKYENEVEVGEEEDEDLSDENNTSDEDENSLVTDVVKEDTKTVGNEEEDELEEKDNMENDDDDEEEEEDDDIDIVKVEVNDEQAEAYYKDPFFRRVNHTMEQKDVDKLKGKPTVTQLKWPILSDMKFQSCDGNHTQPRKCQEKTLPELYVRKRISGRWHDVNKDYLDGTTPEEIFSPLQREIFSILNNYKDLLYCNRTHENAEELRLAYCLHALNHIVKSRQMVLKHNTMLSQNPDLDTDKFRDQGLTRPRVLFLVPFRHAAWKIINVFAKLLLPADQQQISHRKRFNQEYGDQGYETSKIKRPDDFEATFAGNIDDHFRLGVAISRKSMRLYTDFYKSDIIIASPLGLRTVIGAEGDKDRDWDFLSSIEMFIVDQADVFFMQNWEHVMHVMNHLHLQPRQSHDVDFSRVRMWTLQEWSSYYRQTVILSEVNLPEINSLFNKKCLNFSGRIIVGRIRVVASICHVTTQLPQVFHKFESSYYADDPQKRFDFFVTKILPQYSDAVMSRTLIYIPSYFDFVRIRNHFRKNELNFAQICEYTSGPNISRARHHMLKGTRHILLYTERFHFYHRYKLKGIRHIVFYQLPTYPQFFSEICNMIDSSSSNNHDCSILYSKFDVQRIAGIVGIDRCSHMLSSDKSTYLLVTGT